MKNLSAIILLSSFFLVACTKKDYAPNIQTVVYGRAYDRWNNEPYRGLKLMIGEFQEFNFGDNGSGKALVGIRDSAVTDSNGNYKMTFTTSGKGDYYYMSFINVPANVRLISDAGTPNLLQYNRANKNRFDDLQYRAEEIKNIGSSVRYDFDVLKQYYMRSRITFSGNTKPPVTIMAGSAQVPLTGIPSYIYGNSNDTVVNIPILKNTGGLALLFYITDPVTKNLLRNPLIFLNPVINKDTIQGPAFTVYPATFK
ncbi:MAG TPA: hypothetical protein VK671_10810 [Mucilaginibacter sp.]|jgi:hypothetical protein|nr:hypothetical protein [Mucilaginibacter sp.]